jgi:glycosyltransferase involved in cell wall biosynthesis
MAAPGTLNPFEEQGQQSCPHAKCKYDAFDKLQSATSEKDQKPTDRVEQHNAVFGRHNMQPSRIVHPSGLPEKPITPPRIHALRNDAVQPVIDEHNLNETIQPQADPPQKRVTQPAGGRLLRIAMVANLPPPYRIPIYQRIAETPGIKFLAIFCCEREPNRHWDLPALDFDHCFLKERFATVNGRYIHNNPDVVSALQRFGPDIVITNGFNPTHLYAFAYAMFRGLIHVPMTDGTDLSEQSLSMVHRAVRRLVYAKADAFVAASQGGHRLYQQYGIPAEHRFTSCLCVDNDAFARIGATAEKRYDFIFSGRIEKVKNPLFALDVAADAAKRLQRRTSILFVGSGDQEERLKNAAVQKADLVDTHFHGFATQRELPALYASARIFLFPTVWDPWGIVANEACAAGLPVLTSPHAGVAGELVINGENGFVEELDAENWGKSAMRLLTQPDLYKRYSERSRALANNFTFDRAAEGLVDACRHAFSRRGRKKNGQVTGKPPRVIIVERTLLHYREAVYQRLRALLQQDGIELQLLIGEGTPDEKKKRDEAVLDWPIRLPTRYFFNYRTCWLPFGQYARNADMVIIGHENKMLYNLWLMFFRRPRRLAFWGHGRNMQSRRPDSLRERFKRWTINKVDWWFAYTDSSAALVGNVGFPRSRITVINNAIDTRELARLCDTVTEADRKRLRASMGFHDGPIGIYVGSLYKEKRLDFLLEAAQKIRAKLPRFQLIVVGAGPDQSIIEEAAAKHAWIYYAGHLQGRRKAEMLALADIILNPGLVGLGILDSFVSGSPMLTTDCGLHSPEISYMVNGQNGLMTDDDVDLYVEAAVNVLTDPALLDKLKEGARASGSRYTTENMAQRLHDGILACLENT